jgi:N-acetylneuraminic acid mutarotase
MRLRRLLVIALAVFPWFPLIPDAFARDLTFDDRVNAQGAIQRVYKSHQVGDERSFAEAVPRRTLEAQVARYLKLSAALDGIWKTPVTHEMLLAEVRRMHSGSRLPDRQREIETALGDDPILIEECLARPVLVDRMVRNFFALDRSIHAPTRVASERLRARLLEGDRAASDPDAHLSIVEIVRADHAADTRVDASGDESRGVDRVVAYPEEFARWLMRLPHEPGMIGDIEEERERFVVRALLESEPARIRIANYTVEKRPFDAWWQETEGAFDPSSVATVGSRADRLPPAPSSGGSSVAGAWENGILDDVPDPRSGNTAVWTGSVMIVWGGGTSGSTYFNTGGRYDPSTDTWQPMSTTGAPSPRSGHVAVWTGNAMLVWGGSVDSTVFNTGGRYDPVTDTWSPMTTTNAPAARSGATAVWSGSEMIVYGGVVSSGSAYVNSGGRYSAATDTWNPLPTLGAPEARAAPRAVWIAGRMLVWGGLGTAGQKLDSGGLYDPSADSWIPTTSANAPAARYGHALVAVGNQAVVWGGNDTSSNSSITGDRFDPVANAWTATSTVAAPTPRYGFTAVADGGGMIVWSGFDPSGHFLTDGARYDPELDLWTPVTSANAPTGRRDAPAVWTGSRMLLWGGHGARFDTAGGRYDPSTDSWTPTTTANAPEARSSYGAAWTGNDFIVWGGLTSGGTRLNSGGRYNLALDAWQATSLVGAPTGREGPSAVWAGSRVVVWGGANTQVIFYGNGGRYDPLNDTWSAMSTANAPTPRYRHNSVSTGPSMLVWGGTNLAVDFNTGGRYDVATDSWTPTSLVGSPSARSGAKTVWTGREMIVWGASSSSSTGGRYDPVKNSWRPTSSVGAPTDFGGAVATWSGLEMLLWGVSSHPAGAKYNPVTDSWSPVSVVGEPTTYGGNSAVWTGREMIVWGGVDLNSSASVNTGSRYDPLSDSWTATETIGAPLPRSYQTAVWTGNLMLVWGGSAGTDLTSGGGYCACSGPVSTFYQDADGDGVGDTSMPFQACSQPSGFAATAGDCSDADATAWAVPSEARNLILTDDVSLGWSAPSDPGASSLTYDVIRSGVLNDFTSSANCIASNIPLTTATDVDAPAPDQAFYYLVRARNSCPGGVGPLGSWSDGTPRVALNCP